MMKKPDRKIILEDGQEYPGYSFGALEDKALEIVFNTSMVGYQEILSDPSYTDQAVVMTYPLIGNYGISAIDNESEKIHAFGLVIKDLCETPSNANSIKTMDQWLKEQQVPGICGVDTRAITRIIRAVIMPILFMACL